MSSEQLDEHASDKQHLLENEDDRDSIHQRSSQHNDTHQRWTKLSLTLLCSTLLLAVLSLGLAIALYTVAHIKIAAHGRPSPVPPSQLPFPPRYSIDADRVQCLEEQSISNLTPASAAHQQSKTTAHGRT